MPMMIGITVLANDWPTNGIPRKSRRAPVTLIVVSVGSIRAAPMVAPT